MRRLPVYGFRVYPPHSRGFIMGFTRAWLLVGQGGMEKNMEATLGFGM